MSAPDVFLSYNREDQAVAQRFAEGFEGAGMSVWWDVTLRSGENYDAVTEEALKSAKAVVVLWSPRSVVSRWVRAEASIADENGTLVPAKIELCDLPVMFRLTQTADLSHWRGEADDPAWWAFLGDVRRMVGSEIDPEVKVGAIPDKSPATGGAPIVAVLPIHGRGDDKAMEYLAEDLTEEMTRELSQSFYCKVIAASTMAAWRSRTADHQALKRDFNARYVIEGKLQCAGGTARLTVQLIDTESDSMLWSSRFASKLSEIEDSPEQLPRSVAIELHQTIGRIEMNRALAKQGPCSAWEHVLRASSLMGRHGPDNTNRVVDEARAAVSIAPDYGVAHAWLATALIGSLQINRLAWTEADRRERVREIREAVTKALELDGHNPVVHGQLVNAYAGLGDSEAALRLAQRAVHLAPQSAEAHYALGFANFMLGRTSEAIAEYQNQERLAPSDVSRQMGQALLGMCLFIEGRSAEAEEALDKSLTLQPNNYLALRWKAIAAADQGKHHSARAAIKMLRETEPGKSIDDYLESPRHLPIEHTRKYEAVEILRRLLEETEGDG